MYVHVMLWVDGLNAFVIFLSCVLGCASWDSMGDMVIVVLANQLCQ